MRVIRTQGLWGACLGALVVAVLFAAPAHGAKMSIDDVTVAEPDGTATTEAVFTVTLSKKATKTAKASYLTAPGTATGGDDFTHTGGTVKIKPRKRKATIEVTVEGDDAPEADETFTVILSNPVRARLDKDTGVGTIDDNDPAVDSDGDGIPDHLDPCPAFANSQGYCPFEPYDVSDGTAVSGAKAIIANLIVTAVASDGDTAWAAWQNGDVGFDGLAGSGIKIDLTGVTPAPALVPGDRFTAQGVVGAGRVLGAETITETGTGTPTVNVVTPIQFTGTYDRVLTRITGLTFISVPPGGEWQMDGGQRVRTGIMSALPGQYSPGKSFASITGIGDVIGVQAAGIMPRSAADFVGTPMLAGFALDEECVQDGSLADEVGEVSLDEPATSNTVVTVTSGDESVATVPGGAVTIPQGQTSVPVTVDALAPGTTLLTATLGSAQIQQTLSVFDVCQDPN